MFALMKLNVKEEIRRAATLILNDGVKPSTYGFAIVYPSVVDHIIKYIPQIEGIEDYDENIVALAIKEYVTICSMISKSRPFPEITMKLSDDRYCAVMALFNIGLIDIEDMGVKRIESGTLVKMVVKTFRTEL